MPTARFSVVGLALLARIEPICAKISVKATHKTSGRRVSFVGVCKAK